MLALKLLPPWYDAVTVKGCPQNVSPRGTWQVATPATRVTPPPHAPAPVNLTTPLGDPT